MKYLRSVAIEARSRLTSPLRQAQLRKLCDAGNAPMSVLFYHRVADSVPNDWTITRSKFLRHVEYCRDHFDMIGLDELQRRSASGSSSRPSVTFTFDDGYAENSEYALPLLAELSVPCVYFVTVDNIENQQPFPHDVSAGQTLRPNSVNQLREAAAAGIEIGLHTATHVDFSLSDDHDTIRREIYEAKDRLEQLLGNQIRYFAVPYGLPNQLTAPVIQAARNAGLAGLCSAYGAYNFPGNDDFHIRRIHGDPDFARLRNWLTYDHRKVRIEPSVPSFGFAFSDQNRLPISGTM